MEVGGENVDFGKLINVKGNIENITPHKIAVVAFIREYGLLKIEGECPNFVPIPNNTGLFLVFPIKSCH